MSLTLEIEDARWRKTRGLATRLKRAVASTLEEIGADGDLTLLLTNDKHVKALNHDFRGRDQPTNVLSFPAETPGYLGDIAIAYGVTAREAKAADKTLADHATHLAVHGLLHLLGYDHVKPRQADAMERLEVRILNSLHIADPYENPQKVQAK